MKRLDEANKANVMFESKVSQEEEEGGGGGHAKHAFLTTGSRKQQMI